MEKTFDDRLRKIVKNFESVCFMIQGFLGEGKSNKKKAKQDYKINQDRVIIDIKKLIAKEISEELKLKIEKLEYMNSQIENKKNCHLFGI